MIKMSLKQALSKARKNGNMLFSDSNDDLQAMTILLDNGYMLKKHYINQNYMNSFEIPQDYYCSICY